MPISQIKHNNFQTRFFLRKNLTFEACDHFPEQWLVDPSNNKNISVLDVIPEFRFPVLKMISTLEISTDSQVGNVFSNKFNGQDEKQ